MEDLRFVKITDSRLKIGGDERVLEFLLILYLVGVPVAIGFLGYLIYDLRKAFREQLEINDILKNEINMLKMEVY